LTKSAASELGEKGVRVNSICPGGIATGIFGQSIGFDKQKATDTMGIVENHLENWQPLKRSGQPEDIAKAVLFLASDDSSFVNGHAMVVDGGTTLGLKYSDSQKMYGDLYRELLKHK
jgi:NAD(P)-dependent dehydrogenase (short-subunit alcohol dehydrogenase family)